MDYNLNGKRALVTGSSSGIGRAVALALAAEGAVCVVHGRDAERTQATVDEIRKRGGTAHVAIGDLATDEGAQAVVAAVNDACGGLDILVNNAGTAQPMGELFAVEPSAWVQSYEGNVVSAVRMTRAFVPGMRERGWGRVIQIASGTASAPEAQFGPYSASKAAMAAFTVSLTKALTGSGVTVNTVSPGITATEAFQRNLPQIAANLGWAEKEYEAMARRAAKDIWPNPTGRIGSVEEQAAAVVFLASVPAAYINGANLRVDGGIAGFVN